MFVCCAACPACVSHWWRLRNRLSYIAVDYYQLYYLLCTLLYSLFSTLVCFHFTWCVFPGLALMGTKKKKSQIKFRYAAFASFWSRSWHRSTLAVDLKGFCVLMIYPCLSTYLPSHSLSRSLARFCLPLCVSAAFFGFYGIIPSQRRGISKL